MAIYNAALSDEVSALNAIYGEGLIVATFSDQHHTTLSLKLPVFGFSFYLRVLDDYPHSPPEVLGVDDLVESTKAGVQQHSVYFGACVRAVYCPEQVCLFDAIEEFETPYLALQASRQQNDDLEDNLEQNAASRTEILRELALRARAKSGVGRGERFTGDSPFDVVDCSSCLEPFFRVDTANLKCKHSLCPECLHDGVIAMFKARSELRCCGEAVPVRIIRQHGNLDDDFIEGFMLSLAELHAPNPTYCPWEDCLCYIPRRFIKDDYARCPFCKKRICMSCKKKDHNGVCRQDKKLKALIAKGGWKFCPCGQLVARNYGCNHMTCLCGAEFCYLCGKTYESLGRAACECGLFQAGPGLS